MTEEKTTQTEFQSDVSKLLCDPSSPHPTTSRVNESKQYISWEGCTIIMPLSKNPNNVDLAEKIYKRLKTDPVIDEFVALLPPESYHITLRGIRERCKYQDGKEYNEYIVSKYKKMCEMDKIFAESEIDSIQFDFDIKSIDSAPYCGLSLYFENAGPNEKMLRNFEDIAADHLDLSIKEQGWHISLGYFYKNDGKLSKKEKKLIKSSVKSALIDAMKDNMNPDNGMCTFSCSRPTVCYFKDLTQFEKLNI